MRGCWRTTGRHEAAAEQGALRLLVAADCHFGLLGFSIILVYHQLAASSRAALLSCVLSTRPPLPSVASSVVLFVLFVLLSLLATILLVREQK